MVRADQSLRLSRRAFLRLGAGASIAALALPLSLQNAMAQSVAAATPGSTKARIVFHGDRTKRVLALTVDDGWSPERVRVIFGELQRANIAATFMPYTQAMTADRALWRQIADAGYPIGNHTVTHPDLTKLSAARQLAEIGGARSMAEQIIGRPTIRVFRPPYGAYNQSVVNAAIEAGFPTVMLWDTSDRDTSPEGSAAEMIAAGEQGTNGSILMAHGGPVVTPSILPTIIAYYLARGYRFVTVSELLGLPGPVPTTTGAQPAGAHSQPSPANASQPPHAVAGAPTASPAPANAAPSQASSLDTPALIGAAAAGPTDGGSSPVAAERAAPGPDIVPELAVAGLIGVSVAAVVVAQKLHAPIQS